MAGLVTRFKTFFSGTEGPGSPDKSCENFLMRPRSVRMCRTAAMYGATKKGAAAILRKNFCARLSGENSPLCTESTVG